MFITIDNTDMNAHEIDALIKNTRDANGGILPEFAMKILSKTNHIANIKAVIRNIKAQCVDENKKLVPEKVVPFREFILSCVDGREQSEMIMADLRELAGLCGIGEKFEKINAKPKVFNNKDCKGYFVVIDGKSRVPKTMPSDSIVIFCMNKVKLSKYDLSGAKGVRFVDVTKLVARNIGKFPDNIDFSKVDIVDLYSTRGLPEILDLSQCEEVYLSYANLEGVKDFKFLSGATVDFRNAKNLPEILDVSSCGRVYMDEANLESVKEFKFGKETKVNFYNAFNFPEKVDVSECDSVCFWFACMHGVKEVKFRDEAQYISSGFGSYEHGVIDFRGKVVYAEPKKEKSNNLQVSAGVEI